MAEHWCNGQWLAAENYPGASQDRGAFLGLGLFETLLAIDGQVIFPGKHLSRLRASGQRLGWQIDFPELSLVAAELLLRNRLTVGRARLRLIITAGTGSHHNLAQGQDRLVWLSAFPASEIPKSASACLSPWPRNERSPLVGLKTACYAENLVALDYARKLGFDEAIFLNTAGHLCEAATANLFLVKNGVLITPSLASGCLPGVGREVICELAPMLGISLEERVVRSIELETADEIFFSSVTRGPFPVSRLEERLLQCGPVAAQLKVHFLDAAF